MADAPRYDGRSEADLVAATETLVSAWTGWKPSPADALDLGGAMVRLFARMAHHAVDHVDRAPLVHAAELFRLLGVRGEPPAIGRAPLVFTPVEGAPRDPIVPRGSEIAAPADDSFADATSYYTETDLTVLRTGLVDVRAYAPADDALDDVTAHALPAVAEAQGIVAEPWFVFGATHPVERALYVACDALPGSDAAAAITVSLHDAPGGAGSWAARAAALNFALWTAAGWHPLAATATASSTGVAFALTLNATGVALTLAGHEAIWIRITPSAALVYGSPWPTLAEVRVTAPRTLTARSPVQVMAGAFALDTQRDFAPFGTRPAFNDTLYIDAGEVLDQPAGARVSLTVTPSVWTTTANPSTGLVIAWEIRTADAWVAVGYMHSGQTVPAVTTNFSDGTARFKTSGIVAFDLPAEVPETSHAGKVGRWLRARMVRGDYGASESYAIVNNAVVTTASTLAPPWLSKLTLSSQSARTLASSVGDVQVALLNAGHTRLLDETLGIVPFVAPDDTRPALWLAFAETIGGRPVSLHIDVLPPEPDAVTGLLPVEAGWDPDDPARLEWTIDTEEGEVELLVDDDTHAFSRPGIVRFLPPADAILTDRFGRTACWIRARLVEGTYHHSPRLGRIYVNAVWARAATAITGEILGSGTGGPEQHATTRKAPVLNRERVVVRETRGGAWVQWQPVPDFNGSGPTDRHYRLDAATGEISFGDGRRGLPPPLGDANIAIDYETGGGAISNRAAGAITTIRSALPYIAGVTNPVAAAGGRDATVPDIASGEVPRSMRHSDRAVAPADFADLAHEASPDIARVAVIEPDFLRENPVTFDVDTQTTGRGGWVVGVVGAEQASRASQIGTVEIIIVPHGAEARPNPSQALIDGVHRALAARVAPGVRLRVTGPRWVTLTVSAELGAPAAEAARVVADATAALDAWLHPLTGGPGGAGWPFGRRPRHSDIQAVLAEIAGVRFVRRLTLDCNPLLPLPEFVGVERDVALDELSPREAAAALVATGEHALTVVEAR